ncbi:MAG: hypothetical protein JWO98_2057, partial [Frankiales bacterium]|nr:hypothetical protein [Frankiales bacterium]
MIHVQIDVLLDPTDDDTTAIWTGHWEARPIAGDLFHIRHG